MLRSVAATEMADAIAEAFTANAGGAAAAAQARLDRFKSMFPNATSGEVITLTYVPGTGTTVGAGGKDVGTIEGKDFADVLFSAWIGAQPGRRLAEAGAAGREAERRPLRIPTPPAAAVAGSAAAPSPRAPRDVRCDRPGIAVARSPRGTSACWDSCSRRAAPAAPTRPGVLKRIGEIPALRDEPSPFAIVTGASAGAINGAAVAAGSADLHDVTRQLAALWSRSGGSTCSGPTCLVARRCGGLGLLRDLALGGLLGHTVTQALFDTSPLRGFLRHHAACSTASPTASGSGHLYARRRVGHELSLGTLVHLRPGPARSSGLVASPAASSCRSRSRLDHVCASAAIPMVFPPVRVRSAAGELYFGDGALRLATPFSPAIRLGAERVLAVGRALAARGRRR